MSGSDLNIYTDGGSRGNPGPAAIGVYCVNKNNTQIFSLSKRIGISTNNHAEYTAIIEALNYIINHDIKAEKIIFFEDSLLVVNQLNGLFKVKDANLNQLKIQIEKLIQLLKVNVKFVYIPREKNMTADKLVNSAF